MSELEELAHSFEKIKRDSVSELYGEEGLYGTLDYGGPYPIKALPHCAYIAGGLPRKTKILVIGSGNGYEVVYLAKKGFKFCYSVDLYTPDVPYLKGRYIKADAAKLPLKDKSFDMTICCETMEHIPEEYADSILQEAKRVSKEVYFTVATKYDPPFNSHVNVKKPEWWIEKFEKNGFRIINAQINPWFAAPMKGGMILYRSDDGVSVYAKC